VEKLRGIATETNATLVFGHDPDQIKQLRVAAQRELPLMTAPTGVDLTEESILHLGRAAA